MRFAKFIPLSDKDYCLSVEFEYWEQLYKTLYDATGKEVLIPDRYETKTKVIPSNYYDGILELKETNDDMIRNHKKIVLNDNSIEILFLDNFNFLGIPELQDIRLYIPYDGCFDYYEVYEKITGECRLLKGFLQYITDVKAEIFDYYGIKMVHSKDECFIRSITKKNIRSLLVEPDKDSHYIEYPTPILKWGWNNSFILLFNLEKFIEYFYYNQELKDKLFSYRCDKFWHKLEYKLFKCPTPELFAAEMLRERSALNPIYENKY